MSNYRMRNNEGLSYEMNDSISVVKRDSEFGQKFYDGMQVIERQGKTYYVMVPWVEEEELVENYRNLLPFEILLSMMDPTIPRQKIKCRVGKGEVYLFFLVSGCL